MPVIDSTNSNNLHSSSYNNSSNSNNSRISSKITNSLVKEVIKIYTKEEEMTSKLMMNSEAEVKKYSKLNNKIENQIVNNFLIKLLIFHRSLKSKIILFKIFNKKHFQILFIMIFYQI